MALRFILGIGILVLFLSFFDFWNWNEAEPSIGFLGLPTWFYYFLVVQLALGAYLHFYLLNHPDIRERN